MPKTPQAEDSEMEMAEAKGRRDAFHVAYCVTNDPRILELAEKQKSRAIPPAANPSDKTDEEAAEEYRKNQRYEEPSEVDSFLAGCARVRALVGEEIERLNKKGEAACLGWNEALERSEADLKKAEARIQELTKDIVFYRNQYHEEADKNKAQAKLLDLAVGALEKIVENDKIEMQDGGIIDGFCGDIAMPALAAIQKGQGK